MTTKPAWWTDEDLKRLSHEATLAAPGRTTWLMRAYVLIASPYKSPVTGQLIPVSWSVPENGRTCEELREAATCFQRAAKLTSQGDEQQMYLRNAVNAIKTADGHFMHPAAFRSILMNMAGRGGAASGSGDLGSGPSAAGFCGHFL